MGDDRIVVDGETYIVNEKKYTIRATGKRTAETPSTKHELISQRGIPPKKNMFSFYVVFPTEVKEWDIKEKQDFAFSVILGITESQVNSLNITRTGNWKGIKVGKNVIALDKGIYLNNRGEKGLIPFNASVDVKNELLAKGVEGKIQTSITEKAKFFGKTKQEIVDKSVGFLIGKNFLIRQLRKNKISDADLKEIEVIVPRILEKIQMLDDQALLTHFRGIVIGNALSYRTYEGNIIVQLKSLERDLNRVLHFYQRDREQQMEVVSISYETWENQILENKELIQLYLKYKSLLSEIETLNKSINLSNLSRHKYEIYEDLEKRKRLKKDLIIEKNKLREELKKRLKSGKDLNWLKRQITNYRDNFTNIAFEVTKEILNELEIMVHEDRKELNSKKKEKYIKDSRYRKSWEYITSKRFLDDSKKEFPGLRIEEYIDIDIPHHHRWLNIQKLLNDIKKTRNVIKSDKNIIFYQDKLKKQVYSRLNIKESSVPYQLIDSYRPTLKKNKGWKKALFILSIALIPFSFGASGAIGFGIGILDLGISIYFTREDIEEYKQNQAFRNVDFNSKDPSEVWSMVTILSVGLDLPSISSFRKAIKKIDGDSSLKSLGKIERELLGKISQFKNHT